MARFIRSQITGGNTPCTEWVNIDVSQTIVVGDLIQIDATSRLGKVAVAASTSLYGIAEKAITTGGSVTAADKIPVTLLKGAVIRMDYTTGTKTSLVDTDKYSTKFDLASKTNMSLDDTTGGMCQVLGYDNTAKTADVVIAEANLAIV